MVSVEWRSPAVGRMCRRRSPAGMTTVTVRSEYAAQDRTCANVASHERPAMKNTVIATIALTLAACGSNSDPPKPAVSTADAVKIYVAVEEGAAVAVLEGRDLRILKQIAIPDYMPHNVQVAPDGKSVWSANVAMEGMGMQDQLVQIDPSTDEIVARIDLGAEVHPAHVVVTPDSKTVLVTGAEKNEVIRIDAASRKVLDRIVLGHGSGVHGARVSVDGTAIWAAEIDGKCAACEFRKI